MKNKKKVYLLFLFFMYNDVGDLNGQDNND